MKRFFSVVKMAKQVITIKKTPTKLRRRCNSMVSFVGRGRSMHLPNLDFKVASDRFSGQYYVTL